MAGDTCDNAFIHFLVLRAHEARAIPATLGLTRGVHSGQWPVVTGLTLRDSQITFQS